MQNTHSNLRSSTALSVPLLLLGACATPQGTEKSLQTSETAWEGSIDSWGTLQEALRDGQVQGRVAVRDVAEKDVYAIGALEGLRGEITIADGEVWISECDGGPPISTHDPRSAQATVLFATEVAQWHEVRVEQDVDPSELDAYVRENALALGLDLERPFPFLVEGTLNHLQLHVMAGQCPIRARMLGEEAPAPPFEMHAEQARGRLVGLYAPGSTGVLCHVGSQSHVHALLPEEGDLTGHAETVGLAEGSVLKLPQR